LFLKKRSKNKCVYSIIVFSIWISEMFQPIKKSEQNSASNSADLSDSKTKFKAYLLAYLDHYKEPRLNRWIEIIKKHDMSNAKYECFLILI
jgi:hypothetical protein